ncbi:19958_t:CDS:1, partial [Racocetra fulgida]
MSQHRKLSIISETPVSFENKMSNKRKFVETELYLESQEEIKKLKQELKEIQENESQEIKKLKQELQENQEELFFESQRLQELKEIEDEIREEKYKEIINSLQEEIICKNSCIEDLIDRIVCYNAHFGKAFEICQNLYDQEKLYSQVNEVINDFTNESYLFSN